MKNLEDHVDVVGDDIDEGEEGKDEKKASRPADISARWLPRSASSRMLMPLQAATSPTYADVCVLSDIVV